MSSPKRESDVPRPVLRSAAIADAHDIATIWWLGWRDGHLGHVPDDLLAVRTEESFRTRSVERIADTTVAVVTSDVAGFVMVVGDEIEQVYVSSGHRGQGVADVLMAEAERQVAEAGFSTAWLAVVAGNGRARSFYTRSGWSDAGLFSYGAADGSSSIAVPSHRYEKKLL